jgi:hypothetical protein
MTKKEVIKELRSAHPNAKRVVFLDDNGGMYDIRLDYLYILGNPDYTTITITKEEL